MKISRRKNGYFKKRAGSKMSARAFAGIPRQFAKAARFQRYDSNRQIMSSVRMPQMAPRTWRSNEFLFQQIKEVNCTSALATKSMRSFVNRMRCAEVTVFQNI